MEFESFSEQLTQRLPLLYADAAEFRVLPRGKRFEVRVYNLESALISTFPSGPTRTFAVQRAVTAMDAILAQERR